MKIKNKFIEIETSAVLKDDPVTIRFPLTKAELTLNATEAVELWKALDMMYGNP